MGHDGHCFRPDSKNGNSPTGRNTVFFVGFGLPSWAIVLSSAQEQTPVDHQGRLVSLSNGAGGIIVLILYFLLYSFSDAIPVQKLYYIEAGFCLFLIFLLILNPLEGSPTSEVRPSPASVKMIHQEPES